MRPTTPAWKVLLLWALERAGASLWAGTLPGGLFRSQDEGASWQLVEALWNQPGRIDWFAGGYGVPGIHSICSHPQQPDELLIAISCGGIWRSTDNGSRWDEIKAPLSSFGFAVAAHPHDPLSAWFVPTQADE